MSIMSDLGTKIGGEFKTHRLRIENVESGKVDKVAGKQLSSEDFTTTLKTKLDGIATGANNYTLPAASTTTLGGFKVGSNLSIDANGVLSANDTSVNWSEIQSKPTTLSGYGITDAINVSAKGVANGVATLNASGIIPSAQLPSFVDDVLEYTTLSSFPTTGETGKIYVDLTTNKTYRWSGSAYVYITSGAVDSVAGKTGVVTLAKADVGLGSVDNTADSVKNVLSATKLQTARTINGVGFDGSTNINVNTVNNEIIKFDSGINEGTDLYTFNGSTAKTIDIKAGTNVTLTKAAGVITISANDTAVAVGEITGMASGASTFLTTPTSANLAAMLTDETGSGSAVFANSPTLTTPNIGVATGTSFNSITGLSSTAPIMNGAATVGTSTTVARADHIHASDTTKANLSGATFTGNVSAPLFTGGLSGNASSATYQSNSGGTTCDDKFKQTPAHGTSFSECNGVADAPNTGWWIIYNMRHSNNSNYWGTQIAYGWEDNANAIYQRNISAGTWSAWTRVDVSSANITELANNAGFITSSGRAYPRRVDNGGDLNFHWSGQAGQPSWLWGGNDGNNMYVYNPSNFSVNYANSAGSVTASEVIKFDSGTTEGTDLYTFNGSTAKTIDIKAGTNVTLTKTAGTVTISANDTSVNWSEIQSKPTTLSGYGITDSVAKVTSTDNAIVRFNGTTGAVQNSSVIIDDSGNVGIGVVPSGWIDKTLQINGCHILSNDLAHSEIGINTGYSGGKQVYLDTGGSAVKYIQRDDGTHQWQTAPSGTAGNPITWTTAMTLDPSGSLKALGSIISGYNGTSYATPGYTYLAARAVDANSYTALYARNVADANTTYTSYVNGILKSAILANGTFQSATNVYGSTSDIKLKENVVDTTPKLDKLMQVQVRNFNYIGQEEKQIGVIAQEIETIFPSIVFETKDTKQVEVTKTRDIPDVDGNVIKEEYTEIETVETGEVTKNVKYSVIYMMMLKAMQEQQAIINDLKARIEILEGAK